MMYKKIMISAIISISICTIHQLEAMGKAIGSLGKAASAAAKAGAKAAKAAAKAAKAGGKVSPKTKSSLALDKLAAQVGEAAARKGTPYIDDVTDITTDLEKYNEFKFLADFYLNQLSPSRSKADEETQELIDSQFVAYFNLYHMKCTKTRAHVDPPAINFIGAMCKERWQYAPFVLYRPDQQSPNRDVVYPSFPMGMRFGEPELSDWLIEQTKQAAPEVKSSKPAQTAQPAQPKAAQKPAQPQAKPSDTQPLDKSLSAAQMVAKVGYGLAIKNGELVMSGHVTTPPNIAPTTISNEKVTMQDNNVLIHGLFVDVTGKKIYLVNAPGSNADTNKFTEAVKTILSKLAQGKKTTAPPAKSPKPATAQKAKSAPKQIVAEGPPVKKAPVEVPTETPSEIQDQPAEGPTEEPEEAPQEGPEEAPAQGPAEEPEEAPQEGPAAPQEAPSEEETPAEEEPATEEAPDASQEAATEEEVAPEEATTQEEPAPEEETTQEESAPEEEATSAPEEETLAVTEEATSEQENTPEESSDSEQQDSTDMSEDASG